MSCAEIVVRLENANQDAVKTIGLSPDGLITIESWRVSKSKPKANLERRTIGSFVYAPMKPTEALVAAITSESQGYELQTVLDGRSTELGNQPNWISYTSPLADHQMENVKHAFIHDASLDEDIVFARVGTAVIVFMLKSSGVIWLTESRINALFDCLTDHTAMTLLGSITMSLFSSALVPGSAGGGFTDLRQCISPKKLSDAMQERGARSKLFAVPMKFTKQPAAVW